MRGRTRRVAGDCLPVCWERSLRWKVDGTGSIFASVSFLWRLMATARHITLEALRARASALVLGSILHSK